MPKKMDRCVKSVQKSGKSKDVSYAICTASLQKAAAKRKAKGRKKK